MYLDSLKSNKSFGILAHPTSLPGGTYCGTFGEGLKDWLLLLSANKINNWQFLPLSPTDSTGSPYNSPSSFALNTWFLDFNELIEGGFILQKDYLDKILLNAKNLDSFEFKIADQLSKLIGDQILDSWSSQSEANKKEFYDWCKINDWVNDYAVFMALKNEFEMSAWWEWPVQFRQKQQEAIELFIKSRTNEILVEKIMQWHVNRQWIKIKEFASIRKIRLIGDLPFYVAKDSVDVWSNKSLFSISIDGDLFFQSGVPPDYFSSTGQLWGTPVYSWTKHEKTKFDWWKKRFKRQYELVDVLRLDHFRALSGFWRVDGNAKNAIDGEWIKSPGKELLGSLRDLLKEKDLPIIAEDLGVITEDVITLRNEFGLPGMKILQFAFDGNKNNPYLPKNIIGNNWVVYTGTHDNATTISWWENLEDVFKKDLDKKYYLSNNPSWNLIELGMKTSANLFIAPIQDILCLDDRSRLNKPGTIKNNWKWKMKQTLDSIKPSIERYGELGKFHFRVNF